MSCVLTLRLDPDSQALFEALRQRHFPPERNQIPDHLTLFHTLPDSDDLRATLADVAARHPAFALRVTGLRSLGRGVAYTLASEPGQALHRELAGLFADHLTPQDRQRFSPHVVVQNKSTPEAARTLLAQLTASFTPFSVQALGLDLWLYLGGPWELAETFTFAAPA